MQTVTLNALLHRNKECIGICLFRITNNLTSRKHTSLSGFQPTAQRAIKDTLIQSHVPSEHFIGS